ncbi:MAG: 2,4-dienoyl-CoA reductase [Bacteroidota bacterium]
MGSMHTGLEEHPKGMAPLAAFYEERAKGGVALIVTGGISPNAEGCLWPKAAKLTTQEEADHHRLITEAVHKHNGKICLQLLHAGRYAVHPKCVSASAIQAPINMFTPRELTLDEVNKTINDFAQSAALAQSAGYDGVEIMGSEGYLINQFIVTRTNQRTDEYGGSLENRMRFPINIVKAVREKTGPHFIIIYRLSMLDLVEQGSSFDEVLLLAKEIEKAGATIINTGIGWHEARIPTIAMMVPRGAFTWVTEKLMGHISIPLITTNRINMPDLAEDIIRSKKADMISMARPFLADPHWVNKAEENKANEINTCIGCNQACLDQIFSGEAASCLVNPFAGRELKWSISPAEKRKKIAVVGAGPAGLQAALVAAQRGHHVTLFEKSNRIGGQLNYAKTIPSKSEFDETIRYFGVMLEKHGVVIQFNSEITQATVINNEFDEWIIATGVLPRLPEIEGIDSPIVKNYTQVIDPLFESNAQQVVIIGSGGIGMDTARFLLGPADSTAHFLAHWGVDTTIHNPGGLKATEDHKPVRNITLLQRKRGKPGANLGKTTVWAHRKELADRGVQFLDGVTYERISSTGLHIQHKGESHFIPADLIVNCSGQTSSNTLDQVLSELNIPYHLIGGAKLATEVDAKRAIMEATQLAFTL